MLLYFWLAKGVACFAKFDEILTRSWRKLLRRVKYVAATVLGGIEQGVGAAEHRAERLARLRRGQPGREGHRTERLVGFAQAETFGGDHFPRLLQRGERGLARHAGEQQREILTAIARDEMPGATIDQRAGGRLAHAVARRMAEAVVARHDGVAVAH